MFSKGVAGFERNLAAGKCLLDLMAEDVKYSSFSGQSQWQANGEDQTVTEKS